MDLRRGIAVHDHSHLPTRDEAPFSIPWATGCAMLVRADVIHRLSGFDDRYYLTWEDVDLSLRVRAAGYGVVAVPRARIYHKCGRSGARLSPARHYYAVRNSLLVARKHTGHGYLIAACTIVASFIRRSLRNEDRQSVRDHLLSVFHGVRDHLRGVYGPCPQASR
jgi:GT2 family glycosyltransferase